MAYERFAYIYDRLMQDMPYDAWLQFMEEAWTRWGKPQTIVDLGCGTGNLAIPLAQKGLHVSGIDLSEEMLAVAAAKSESAAISSGSIRWIQQDMCEWELPSPADCVISFCDSLNYLLDESSVLDLLRNTHRGLTSEGLFLFDIHTEKRFNDYAQDQPFILDEEDISYLWSCDWEEDEGIITHDLAIFVKEAENYSDRTPQAGNNGSLYRRIDEIQQQRAYPLIWWKQQVEVAGFELLGCYADFSFEPADESTDRAFFIARKAK